MKEILLTEKGDGIPCVIIFPCFKQSLGTTWNDSKLRCNDLDDQKRFV